MRNQLREKINESLASVLPITAIILLLSITVAPLDSGVVVLFLFGSILLIFGMGFFTLGADMAMLPMGEGIGVQISKSKRILISLCACFVLGLLITVAEPDLQVLATQIPSISNMTLILSVGIGVGAFLTVALLRTLLQIRLSHLLVFFYAIVFILAIFAPNSFIPAAFDSGGVTTGPITVPFIMAFGIGMASIRSDKHSSEDSFGLIAICSIGPILSVLLLGICYEPSAESSVATVYDIVTTRDAVGAFGSALVIYLREVAAALLPIVLICILFQIFFRRFRSTQLPKIAVGFFYTYMGLVLFLTGVNVGFMPAGQLIGAEIAGGDYRFLLIPIGMLVGYFIVAAEPAVHVLKKQVEEISNGSITQRSIGLGLSAGVSASVGIAMLRILTGVSILWFLVPGYIISLIISFYVPPIYTGIAFDSGGVASGPMTATFLLPLAMGACQALGGDIMTDAFGIVAMVAMTPLITIQTIGLFAELRKRNARRDLVYQLRHVEDSILYFDESPAAPRAGRKGS